MTSKHYWTCLIGIAFSFYANAWIAAQQAERRISFAEVLRREDSNQDGKVTRDEFRAPNRLFERLDRDANGVLTQQDFDKVGARSRAAATYGVGPFDNVKIQRDIVFGKGGSRDLKMHMLRAEEPSVAPQPTLVFVHGGGWQGGSKDSGIGKLLPLVRAGFVGATIDYRLTGEAPFPAQIEDCKCAIRYLRAHAKELNVDANRIAVMGSSAGGHLVALLGTSADADHLEGDGGWTDQSSRVQAVIDLYGPTDFRAFVTAKGYEKHNRDRSPESKLLGGGEVLANPKGIQQVNPITYVDASDPPFLIIHGSNDPTVPLNQSELLHRALRSANVVSTLHVIEGAGHGGAAFSAPNILELQRSFLVRAFGLDAND